MIRTSAMMKNMVSCIFVSFCMGIAQAKENTSGQEYSGVTTGTILETLFALALVVIAILVTTWLIKRINPRLRQNMNAGGLKVISNFPLGNRERLVIIEIYGKHLLLGVTPGNISLVKDLTDVSGKTSDQNQPSSATSKLFQGMLRR